MSVLYTNLSDEELEDKITTLTAAYEKAMLGGVATVVAGGGRRMEYTTANASGLLSLITAATREKQRRSGVQTTGAIRVVFPYGG